MNKRVASQTHEKWLRQRCTNHKARRMLADLNDSNKIWNKFSFDNWSLRCSDTCFTTTSVNWNSKCEGNFSGSWGTFALLPHPMAESLYFKRFSLKSKQMMLQIREPIAMLSLAYTYFVLLYKQLRFFEQLKLQPPVYAPAMYCYSIQQSWCFHRKWNTAKAKRSIKYYF